MEVGFAICPPPSSEVIHGGGRERKADLRQNEVFNQCFEVGLVERFGMEGQGEEESEFRERRESFRDQRERETSQMRRESASSRYISVS